MGEYVHDVTAEKIRGWYEKVPYTDCGWRHSDGQSLESYTEIVMRADAIVEFSFGVLIVYWREGFGSLHPIFWGREVVRSIPELREAAKKLIVDRGYEGLRATVPVNLRGLRRLLERLGFHATDTKENFYPESMGCRAAVRYTIMDSEL